MAFSFILPILSLLFLAHACVASDPDPVSDFFVPGKQQISSSSPQDDNGGSSSSYGKSMQSENSKNLTFSFRSLMENGDVSIGPGGKRAALTPSKFPGMRDQGLTYVRFEMVPCGINLPHTHPRASEMLTLLQGGPLQVGFVDTKGDEFLDILHPGDVTIFPRGLMHYELNVGNETAHFISALNSENPGALVSGNALFKLPMRALAASLNANPDDIKHIKDNLFAYGSTLQLSPPSMCTPGQDISTDT